LALNRELITQLVVVQINKAPIPVNPKALGNRRTLFIEAIAPKGTGLRQQAREKKPIPIPKSQIGRRLLPFAFCLLPFIPLLLTLLPKE